MSADRRPRAGADRDGPDAPGGPDDPETGDAAARAALARARDAARARGLSPGRSGTRRTATPGAGAGFPPSSGHGTGRDPKPLGSTLEGLAGQLGWTQPLSMGAVVGRWREVVGDQVADHCSPETFEEGALVVRADSTAWATQIRLLLPQLERRLAQEVGEGVVTSIRVLGPGGPTWRKGPRSVRGRGPRDTYG